MTHLGLSAVDLPARSGQTEATNLLLALLTSVSRTSKWEARWIPQNRLPGHPRRALAARQNVEWDLGIQREAQGAAICAKRNATYGFRWINLHRFVAHHQRLQLQVSWNGSQWCHLWAEHARVHIGEERK
jgi:hypothetical protein